MIIFFTEEGEYKPAKTLNHALENIAYQCRSGNHILMGDRDLLLRIADSPSLDPRASSLIRNSAQKMTQQGALLAQSPWILEIDTSNVAPNQAHLVNFSDSDLCEKSQILAENPTDSSILASLAETYIQKYLSGYRLSIRCQNGGGSTIGSTLRQITDQSSGCVLCVVDSDRTFPGSRIGSTAKSAKQAQKRVTPHWRSRLHVIEQRELENIIPLDIRNHCITKHTPDLLETSNLIDKTSKFYSDHFCLKSGDSMCRIFNSMISGKHTSKIGDARLASVDSPLPPTSPCGTCANDNRCKQSKGFGTGFLGWVSEELRSKNITSDPTTWRNELTTLVKTVAFLGIGNHPMRT